MRRCLRSWDKFLGPGVTGESIAVRGDQVCVSWIPLLCRLSLVPSKYSMTVMICIMMLSFYYFSRHVSACTPCSAAQNLSLRAQAPNLRNAGCLYPALRVTLSSHHLLHFLVSSVTQAKQCLPSFFWLPPGCSRKHRRGHKPWTMDLHSPWLWGSPTHWPQSEKRKGRMLMKCVFG